jgi:hypothetical protein
MERLDGSTCSSRRQARCASQCHKTLQKGNTKDMHATQRACLLSMCKRTHLRPVEPGAEGCREVQMPLNVGCGAHVQCVHCISRNVHAAMFYLVERELERNALCHFRGTSRVFVMSAGPSSRYPACNSCAATASGQARAHAQRMATHLGPSKGTVERPPASCYRLLLHAGASS